jgi:hypothetical protein
MWPPTPRSPTRARPPVSEPFGRLTPLGGAPGLAHRLLGVSRSLPGTVLAGVAGRLAALALSLAIASGDTGAPGSRNLWVFAAVFTLPASGLVELLAKPGALARAQPGLVSIPDPLRALRRSGQRLSR